MKIGLPIFASFEGRKGRRANSIPISPDINFWLGLALHVNIKSKTGGFLRNLYKWLYAGYLGKRFSTITENLFLAHNLWLTIFITITANRVQGIMITVYSDM